MSKPKIRIGKNSEGRTTIKIRISKDDPIRSYILALAQRAAYKTKDPDGFYEEKEPVSGAPEELEALIFNMLPPDLKNTFLEESATVKAETIDQLINSDLSGLLGLMSGNIWQQESTIKENPNLEPFKNIGGALKSTLDEVLGDTSVANHVKSEIQKGTFDEPFKGKSDQDPQ